MGLLGITAAFIVGTVYGVDEDTVFAGFPGDLFIILVLVDPSPFSTSGALVVANTADDRREFVNGKLLQWGMSMIIVAR